MATVQELEQALHAADAAGDMNAARQLAAAIQHARSTESDTYVPPTKKMGVVDTVIDTVTGESKKTKTSESLPDWATMPELNSLSLASAKTGLGTVLSSPKETAEIIKSNYPEAKVRQDEKGNWVIQSSIDGKEYAIKPGFRVSDIPRALTAFLAFTPAGAVAAKAPTLAEAALLGGAAAAGTQTAIEATQAATGGQFNPEDIALAEGAGAIFPPVVSAVKAVANPAIDLAKRAMGAPKTPLPVAPVTPPAAPATPVPPVAPMAAPELTQTAKTAAAGGMGSKGATSELVSQTMPDQKVVEAAERLGIRDYLQPDHVTTNQAYRELAQAVKSQPGSLSRTAEIEGLNAIGKRADDLISEIGGSQDLSNVSAAVKGRLQATQKALDSQAEKLYGELRKGIPAKAEAPAPSVLQFIEQRADELGGREHLSGMEKTILNKLGKEDKIPSYALLDDVRRDLGTAGKMSGVFKDADKGLAKKLYGLLSQDQQAVAEAHGMLDTFKAAQSAVKIRKGVEDDLISLFGKTLDNSIVGSLGSAVKSLPSGDAAKFIRLIKLIPEEMRQEVTASGLATAFGKQTQNGALNFNSYAKWYDGLVKNKQAYTALMANLPPSARKQLSDLYRVSKAVSMATRERITTGRIQAVNEELRGADSLIGDLYNLAKRSAVGVAGEAITTPMGAPGAGIAAGVASALTKGKPNAVKAVDALISSPEFTEAVKQYAQGNSKQAAVRLAYSKPFTKFVRAVGNPQELSNRERWILQTLEAQSQVKESK